MDAEPPAEAPDDPYAAFPPGFFDRADDTDDARFYAAPRFVTHLDDRAVAAVGALYEELGLTGTVMDLMSSWVSHFRTPPRRLIAVGMNAAELAANDAAAEWHVVDLNDEPALPLADGEADAAVCCVSVDYLTRPVETFREVGRVLRPGGLFVNTFSNRCFPTKAIRGWLQADDDGHLDIVRAYYRLSGVFDEPVTQVRVPPSRAGFLSGLGLGGDPLYAVWAARAAR